MIELNEKLCANNDLTNEDRFWEIKNSKLNFRYCLLSIILIIGVMTIICWQFSESKMPLMTNPLHLYQLTHASIK